jgi:hypothetical protein
VSSKLAQELGVDSIPAMIFSPLNGRRVTAINADFWERELATGNLSRVFFLPGFACIHTKILEAWFETVPAALLASNRQSEWFNNSALRRSRYERACCDWLRKYARALTHHALKIGYLIRGRCLVCGAAPADAHHPDYSDPLRITWLCDTHHSVFHGLVRSAHSRQPAGQVELFQQFWWSRSPSCLARQREERSNKRWSPITSAGRHSLAPFAISPAYAFTKEQAAQELCLSVKILDRLIEKDGLLARRLNPDGPQIILRHELLRFLQSASTQRQCKREAAE